MNNKNTIDFSPLKGFGTPLRIDTWLRRMFRIGLWLVFLGLIGLVAFVVIYLFREIESGSGGGSWSYSSSSSVDASFVYEIPVMLFLAWMIAMSWCGTAWQLFAKKNNFSIEADDAKARELQTVPSFRGKQLSWRFYPIIGTIGQMKFVLFIRIYKEGGILRWRERKMDTIMMLQLNKELPHIVVNARANERARRSNLSVRYPNEMKFQFEGTYGTKYENYTAPADRVVALQVFTPDVLDTLYTKLPTTDIEIQGNRMWLVQRYTVLDDRSAQELFEAATALYDEISHQTASIGAASAIPS